MNTTKPAASFDSRGVGFKECLFLLLALFFFQSAGFALGEKHEALHMTEIELQSVAINAAFLFTAATAVLVAGRRLIGGTLDRVGFAAISPKHLAISLFAGFALAAAVAVATTLWPHGPAPEKTMVQAFAEGNLFVRGMWLASTVVMAPVVEEILFRGFVLSWLGRRFGWTAGIAGSALAFLLLHLPQVDGYQPAIAGITALGLLCGASRRFTGSLLGCIALHAAYNALTVFLVLAGD